MLSGPISNSIIEYTDLPLARPGSCSSTNRQRQVSIISSMASIMGENAAGSWNWGGQTGFWSDAVTIFVQPTRHTT